MLWSKIHHVTSYPHTETLQKLLTIYTGAVEAKMKRSGYVYLVDRSRGRKNVPKERSLLEGSGGMQNTNSTILTTYTCSGLVFAEATRPVLPALLYTRREIMFVKFNYVKLSVVLYYSACRTILLISHDHLVHTKKLYLQDKGHR